MSNILVEGNVVMRGKVEGSMEVSAAAARGEGVSEARGGEFDGDASEERSRGELIITPPAHPPLIICPLLCLPHF
jgi:hypothetical protein